MTSLLLIALSLSQTVLAFHDTEIVMGTFVANMQMNDIKNVCCNVASFNAKLFSVVFTLYDTSELIDYIVIVIQLTQSTLLSCVLEVSWCASLCMCHSGLQITPVPCVKQ